MSVSQPGPYQSRVLRGVVRQVRQWADQINIALRQLRNTADWAAQLVLFPVYVVFQTVRLAGAQVRQAVGLGLPALQAIAQDITTQGVKQTLSGAVDSLTADTPIQQAMLTVQRFSLSIDLPVLLDQTVPPETISTADHYTADHSAPEFTLRSFRELVVSTLRTWVQRLVRKPQPAEQTGLSTVESTELAPASGGQRPQPQAGQLSCAKVFVRGIASLVETKTLVLITNQNQVLDVLTIEQQIQLRQRIAWETAHYGRYLRLRQATRQALRSRLASENPHLLLPVRLFRRLMGWVQTSPLAIAANLFQESSLPALTGTQPFASLPARFQVPALSLPVLPSYNPLVRVLKAVSSGEMFASARTPAFPFSPFSALSVSDAAQRIRNLLTSAIQALRVPHSDLSLPDSDRLTAQSFAPGSELELLQSAFPTSISLPVQSGILSPVNSPSSPSSLESGLPDYLETDVISMDYVLSPLELVLRWVDRFLLWLEKGISILWNWVLSLLKRDS
ncbi:hypothetical protein J5X98_27430 [Leptothermofonsia sichuanensis E412]|uniref:hypothetical protein n=1 Tax=Leptothermofonsia sichuanensis TaxID=2917832 RepID=UPI001CA6C03D|nr:hypothetical protein [Leptothermofonsia sichuanensis]QZZ20886.1 hypothetical protein J5X98_27430 [Leptothermofonsia sichuanensis E412]